MRVESSGLIKVEKFVDAGSIDPIYYDASYYLAPDGKGSEDVYAVLREAIERTGKVALTRVVIAQRERTIALRPMDGGLVAHTLNEQRDLNSAEDLFAGVRQIKLDPEMVTLATQLVERQSGNYDPLDLEDRYESRMRTMLDAKIAGHAVQPGTAPVPLDSNVIDLMAALRKSLGGPMAAEQSTVMTPARAKSTKRAEAKEEAARKQPGLKLPLQGGKKPAAKADVQPTEAQPTARSRRKAS